MRNRELELRKRALEAQFQADVELLRAAYEVKLRAVEMTFLLTEEELPPRLLKSRAMLRLSAPVTEKEPLRPESDSPPPDPPKPARRRGEVVKDLNSLFEALPEEFDARDVERVLGYKPSRGTMHRALSALRAGGWTKMSLRSDGPHPTRYRKISESTFSPEEAGVKPDEGDGGGEVPSAS